MISNNPPAKKKRVYRRKKSKNKKQKDLPKFRELFIDRLVKNCSINKKTATKIEKGAYTYVSEQASERSIPHDFKNHIFRNYYFNKIRSIYTNLLKNSYVKNNNLHSRIKKEIKPENLAFMKPQSIHPENWKQLVEERERRYKLLYELREDEITGVFQCGKCGSWKTKHTEAQTRSADEAMTVFVLCYNCGKSWKQ